MRRTDLIELVRAANFVVDVAQHYDRRSVGWRVAVHRLEQAAAAVGEDPVLPVRRCAADWSMWVFAGVVVVVLLLALYGLVHTYGWFA